MQRHCAIEVSLGGPHPDGNRGHLNDFCRMLSHHVTPKHSIGGLLHHELEQTPMTIRRQGPCHRTEIGPMDGHGIGPMAIPSVLLGKPDRGELGVAEHCARHKLVVHLAVFAAEGKIGVGPPFIHSNRCEIDAIRDVANGMDVRNRRA